MDWTHFALWDGHNLLGDGEGYKVTLKRLVLIVLTPGWNQGDSSTWVLTPLVDPSCAEFMLNEVLAGGNRRSLGLCYQGTWLISDPFLILFASGCPDVQLPSAMPSCLASETWLMPLKPWTHTILSYFRKCGKPENYNEHVTFSVS